MNAANNAYTYVGFRAKWYWFETQGVQTKPPATKPPRATKPCSK